MLWHTDSTFLPIPALANIIAAKVLPSSGGQTELEAAENLNLINKYNDTNFIMSYSYGRALQQSAIQFWSKDIKNIKGTQEIFNHRANMCSLAAQGKWSKELEGK